MYSSSAAGSPGYSAPIFAGRPASTACCSRRTGSAGKRPKTRRRRSPPSMGSAMAVCCAPSGRRAPGSTCRPTCRRSNATARSANTSTAAFRSRTALSMRALAERSCCGRPRRCSGLARRPPFFPSRRCPSRRPARSACPGRRSYTRCGLSPVSRRGCPSMKTPGCWSSCQGRPSPAGDGCRLKGWSSPPISPF